MAGVGRCVHGHPTLRRLTFDCNQAVVAANPQEEAAYAVLLELGAAPAQGAGAAPQPQPPGSHRLEVAGVKTRAFDEQPAQVALAMTHECREEHAAWPGAAL